MGHVSRRQCLVVRASEGGCGQIMEKYRADEVRKANL
jgi:hypothetical protein